jgi:hypothetical protein
LKPAETIIDALIFFLPISSMTEGTILLGVATTAKSISSFTSRTLLYAFIPNTEELLGVIG